MIMEIKSKVKLLICKYRVLFSYAFWGALTTVVNYLGYFICTKTFNISYLVSNVLAWTLSVAFAFVTNKVFVFKSKQWEFFLVFKELWKFVSIRLFSGILETVFLFIFVEHLYYDSDIVKIFTNVMVIIMNYIFSKFIVFKKRKGEENE